MTDLNALTEKSETTPGKTEKIGEFLVKIGAIKPWQVEDILLVQKSGDSRMFGELAVTFGYIDDKALQQYVESHTPAHA